MNFILNSILSIFGRFFGAFIGLLSGIILARALGPEKLGVYQIFLSTQTVIITIFSLGIGNASIYFINIKEISQKEIVSSFIKIFVPLSVFVSLVYAFVILFFDNYFSSKISIALIMFVIGTGCLVLSSILRPILYAKQKIKEVTFLNILPQLILLIGIAITLILSKVSVETALFFWGIGNFLAALLLLFYFKKDIDLYIKLSAYNVKKVVFYGIKLAATNLIFVMIGNVSVFLLKYQLPNGFEAVGLYSRAVAICSLVFMIPSSIGPILFSKWSGLEKTKLKLQVQQTIRTLTSLTFFIAILVVLFRTLIIGVLYGDQYLSIEIVVAILAPTLIFQTISEVINNMLASIGKAHKTLIAFLSTFIVIVFFSFLLIPLYGMNGAAISIFIGTLFNAIFLLFAAKKHININFKNTFLLKNEDYIILKNYIKKTK